jgi:hypothetical protein
VKNTALNVIRKGGRSGHFNYSRVSDKVKWAVPWEMNSYHLLLGYLETRMVYAHEHKWRFRGLFSHLSYVQLQNGGVVYTRGTSERYQVTGIIYCSIYPAFN